MIKKRQLVSFSDRELEAINSLADERGQSFQWVLHFAISELIKNEKPRTSQNKPDYIAVKEEANRIAAKKLELADKFGKVPTTRELKQADHALAICNLYNGKVDGNYCIFTQYWGSKDMPVPDNSRISEQRVPLSQLDDSWKQYPNGKEEYMEWCSVSGKDPYHL